MIANKTAVFFDLDHTLWDFEKNSALAFEEIIANFKIGISPSEFNSAYSPINAQYWKLYRDGHITQQELRYGRLRDCFARMGYTADDDLLHILSEEYIRLLPENSHLFEGTLEILDYLKDKYKLHIITNGPHEVQERKLANAGISHYFSTVTNSELAGCKKPHAGIFHYALSAAGVKCEEAVMIGDCIEADVQGAIACGLDAIYFNENRLDTPSHITQVHHLLELKNLL